jgi:acyl carrier protein phosphodiesterase
MNWLAHAFLSDDDDLLVGNLVADFARPGEAKAYAPAIQAGIALHRIIDDFTDRHPVPRRSGRRWGGSVPVRGIVVDVLYDHLLARTWAEWSPWPLSAFAGEVYRVLQQHEARLPARLRQALPSMVGNNWFVQYGTEAGIRRALAGLSRRMRRNPELTSAVDVLQRDWSDFARDFREFFPQLQARVVRELGAVPACWHGAARAG